MSMRQKLQTIRAVAFLFFISPIHFLYAQDTTWLSTLGTEVLLVLKKLFYLLILLSFLIFIWGLIGFIASSGNENKQSEGKKRMLWGIFGLFILISVWGIVRLLQGLFGVTPPTTSPSVPAVIISMRI